ncbi:ATP-grasp domain-containing protein [Natranaerobius trueperi]|uniref:Carboxylate--amine ligase n=1 Tax=Natranaerobius trueperi TaxID=759412 RepID=A0A226C2F9_9FIRM|nr:ATP-grasp domain-containing protein [Natranaerobius trueperi]OWZ84570.1 carboxylate--amine ligase [Natranaerobius trueperi]
MNLKKPAIVLGVNYYIGLSVIRSLGLEGIHVTAMDNDESAYGMYSKYVSEKVIIPDIKENENGLLEFLISYAKKLDEKPVLIPAADSYAIFISNNTDQLEEYFLFPPMPRGLVADLVNKRKLYEFAQKYGMPIPKTFFPETEEDLKNLKSDITYPCIVKPELSHEFVKKFRKKLFIANNTSQLIEAVRVAIDANLSVMVQEIISGSDDHMYTYNAYFDKNSNPVKVFTNRKKRQFPIHFGASVFTESTFEPNIIHLGEEFLKKLGYHGIVEIEFKKDPRTGKFYMIEINPRLTNFNNVILKSGINLPATLYYELIGEQLTKQINREEGLKFVYLYEDIRASLDYISNNELTLFKWISSYIGPLSHAIYHPKDINPLLVFIRGLFKKLLRKLVRRFKSE